MRKRSRGGGGKGRSRGINGGGGRETVLKGERGKREMEKRIEEGGIIGKEGWIEENERGRETGRTVN